MTSLFGSDDPAPAPPLPKIELAPPPVLIPGRKAGGKPKQTTFLGAEMVPGQASGNTGGKTLLGM